MEDKKLIVAITGANGFIGKHLADRFILDGHKVASVPRELLMDQQGLEEYFSQLKPDYIYHLASYGNMASQNEEDEVFATNIIKTYFLLKSLLKIDYKAFINVSSSSVYGKKTKPMKETDNLETDSIYGATKVSAEYLCRYFAHKYNKPIVTARPFTVIGVGEQEEHLIPTLIRHAGSSKTMSFVSEPSHDFVDVYDVVEALLHLSLYAKDYPGHAFNIGTGIYWTNEQVKQAVESATKKKIKTKEIPQMRDYDAPLWVADPTKLKLLGWVPIIDFETTIINMVEYEKKRKGH